MRNEVMVFYVTGRRETVPIVQGTSIQHRCRNSWWKLGKFELARKMEIRVCTCIKCMCACAKLALLSRSSDCRSGLGSLDPLSFALLSLSLCLSPVSLSRALIIHASYAARRAFGAHNEPVSGRQNELINPPETARVMRR